MKKVFSFVKGKRDDKKDTKVNPPISVEITNPSGQKITSDDEHIVGLQQGYGYNIDLNGKDKNLPKLHKAVWVGNLEKVKIHLKKIDINSVDSLNRTPLHLAVAQGHTEIAWYLLNNNASMDACDSEGLTPFLKAIECGNKDCVNLLIECGVKVSCTDRNGNNGLHLASKHGFYNIASLLLKEGVTLDLANNVGEYPLHIATGCEHRELVELLLSSGGNVEVLDRERRTPLMIAARSGFFSIIKVLLDSGSTLEAADSNGWTAEDYAQFGGHQDLVEILKAGQKEDSNIDQSERLSVQSSDTSENVPQPQPQSLPDHVVEDQQDSPRSCITPPALEPPRSWDLIQSGAIDQGSENRRRSFMTLGPLRSHQEVLSDGNSDSFSKNPELNSMMLPSPTGDQINLENRLSPVPATTPERRTRSPLERVNSLDLPSDQDSPLGLDCGLYSPDEALPVFNDLWERSPKYSATHIIEQNTSSVENDSFENNNNFPSEKKGNANINESVKESSELRVNGVESDSLTNDNCANMVQKENNEVLDDAIRNGVHTSERISSLEMSDSFEITKSSGTDNFYAGASCSLDNLEDSQEKRLSIEIIQSTGKLDDTLSICTVPIKAKFRESHSLDLLETVDCDGMTRSARGKKHYRNKSITLSGQPQLWKSVDALPKPSSLGGADIDAQLQCYDEALRQLANVNMPKQNQANKPPTNESCNVSEAIALDVNNLITDNKNIIELEPCIIPTIGDIQLSPGLDPDVKTAKNESSEIFRNEPTSLEIDKDESFPPPPICFMESDDDITHLNSVEIPNNALPMTKLTPIKENYLELDSLTSNTDAPDSDNTENSIDKSDSECECLTRPLRRKRKILAAMRSPGMDSKNEHNAVDDCKDDDDDDNESTEGDPPFWQNTDKGGHFMRQETVVTMLPTSQTPRNTPCGVDDGEVAGTSSEKREGEKDSTSPSSDAETASVADTPKHAYTPKSHQGVLQAHLREATIEKGRLEETAANLREKAERLKYELADARQAEIARDDTIAILQAQLKRLEDRYTKAQEDLCTLRQRATNAEHELQHLRQLCSTLREEKEELCRELAKHAHCELNNKDLKQSFKEVTESQNLHNKLKILEEEKLLEEEKNKHLVLHLDEILEANHSMVSEKEALIAQNIADVKKLQEDTLCWKERYEECAAKLELMDKSIDPRLIEAQDTIATLKRTISILQQEKATHAKLIDASTSTNSPLRNRSCPLVGNDGNSLEKDGYQEDTYKVKVMKELNTLKEQLENCLSASHYDVEPTQKRLIELQQKLEVEIGKRFALDLQVKQLMNDFQEKLDLGAEINKMNRRLEREFVSKEEFERVTSQQDEAIGKIQQQVALESETKFSDTLEEINQLLQQQAREQAKLSKMQVETEISIKHELENTRQKLQHELSKVHSTLEAKEAEEKFLRKKCEHLAKEVERIQDIRRKSLIEKSYSINLSDLSPSRTGNGIPQAYASVPLIENSARNLGEAIRVQLDKSLKKHVSGPGRVPECSMEENLAEELKLKYLKN